MPSLILTTSTVINCPHGGIVLHNPTKATSYRVNGEFAMLFGDVYIVWLCPHKTEDGEPDPCSRVEWQRPSSFLAIQGKRALLNTSIGVCQSKSGIVEERAIIVSHQTAVYEPHQLTVIND